MAFDNIRGHKAQIDFLTRSFQNNRINQAYLFVGKEGIGKFLIAKNFAKLLNCEEKNRFDCCELCGHCLKIEHGLHPDISYIQPDGEAIKIEQIRQLKRFFAFAPYEANYKIAIIDGAELLTVEASNSLLKILEEPNKKDIFIVIATTAQRVLPTVISRCQVLRFNSLSYDVLYSLLCSNYGFEQSNAKIIMNYCNGSLGSALKLKEANFMTLRDNIITNFLMKRKDILSQELIGAKDSQDFKRILFILLTLLRDSFILKTTLSHNHIINLDYTVDIQEFYKNFSTREIFAMLSRILEIYEAVDKNVNKRIIMESFLSYITL